MVRQSPSLALGFLVCRVGCWTRRPSSPCQRSLWSSGTHVVSHLLARPRVWKQRGRGRCVQRLLQVVWKGSGEHGQSCSFPGRLQRGLHRCLWGHPFGFCSHHVGLNTFSGPHTARLGRILPDVEMEGVCLQAGGWERGVLWNSLMRLEGSGEATAAASGAAGGRGWREEAGEMNGGGDKAEK